MTVNIIEEQIKVPGYFILGATFAKCPVKGIAEEGTLLMNAALFNGSDSGVGNMLYRSRDEGKSWEQLGFIEKSYKCDKYGSMIKHGGNAALYTDTKAGVILFTSNEMYWSKNSFNSTKSCSRFFYRLSYDNGATWTDKRYAVLPGHTMENPIPDVVYGRNFALSMASQTLRTDADDLLVALQCQIVDENGKLVEPAGFHFFQSGALHARWNEEKNDYDWSISNYVRVTPEESMRGVFEPTFAKLSENRYIMIMRNSNMKAPHVIGQKFFSVSDDNGMNWSRPQPLRYDDGGVMYASSCVPKLLAHSNGKLYYIGVINDKNPDGNLPRTPLCIAEVDKTTCTIRRDTVTVIDQERQFHRDQIKAASGKLNLVDYSNHGVFEDSLGRIVVYAPFRRDLSKYECVLNRYEIEV